MEYRNRRGERPNYHLIPGGDREADTLRLVFLQFPVGEDKVEIVFKHYSYEDLPVVVSRTDTTIDLSGLKKKTED